MSRLSKYKDSLLKFIKDRTTLYDKDNVPHEKLIEIFDKKVKENTLILPILFLTIMNSQNKKNKVSMQGYFIASSILFIDILFDILENKDMYKNLWGPDLYDACILYLINTCYKSLHNNLESIKKQTKPDNYGNICLNMLELFNNYLTQTNLHAKITLEKTDNSVHNNLLKWYIKDNEEQKEKFLKIKQITRESFNNFIIKKIGKLCEMAVHCGWIFGCGDENKLDDMTKISKYFTMMFKLSLDFTNLDSDINNTQDNISKNYVINYGLQDSYEIFMYNKQKFIEELMLQDIYTNTIREIIDHIEKKVDDVIDETSPDLKSSNGTASSTV